MNPGPMRSLRASALAASVLLSLLCGCALDVNRERVGTPLDLEAFETLEPGSSDLGDSLDALGAPHLIERENDDEETHLWWIHRDLADINLRLQLPLSFFGYRHNVFQYFQGDDQNNTIHLAFDDEGQLLQKELHLPEGFEALDSEPAPAVFHLSPRAEYSLLVEGDADFRDYDEIFDEGYLLGFDFGYQPVAPLVISLGLSYQEHEGQDVDVGPADVEFGDLRIWSAQVLVRLQIPFEVFGNLFNYAEVRRVLLAEDPSVYDGWLVYLEGGLGAAYNEDVSADFQGNRLGDFFDDGVGMTNVAGAGIEYSLQPVSFRLGGTFRSIDAFSDGDTVLADEAEGLGLWMVGASMSFKF